MTDPRGSDAVLLALPDAMVPVRPDALPARSDATSSAAFDAADPRSVRLAIREGRFTGFTNHVAPGYVQGNLVVLPETYADAFAAFCAANPAALPLLARGETGSPQLPSLAADLDLRTDVGLCAVYRDGILSEVRRGIGSIWRDDLVAFVIGCSFSFEQGMIANGIRLRHLEEGGVSAMYVTDRDTVPAGPFGGSLVVSMRPMTPADAIRATILSAPQRIFHGAPVHIGLPHALGIADLRASYGGHGLTVLNADELPVFWACGATGQLAAMHARLPFCITHYKAHMVVTDLTIKEMLE